MKRSLFDRMHPIVRYHIISRTMCDASWTNCRGISIIRILQQNTSFSKLDFYEAGHINALGRRLFVPSSRMFLIE